ncbi:MaoC family dehydratase [Bermanella sp. R86510]|uniref:MaoC family dehydratase n=1 Tax=unclassified Bermanella TaxID=2627862 RepID=UPI0037C795A4
MNALTLKHVPSIPSLYFLALCKNKAPVTTEYPLGLAIRVNDIHIDEKHLKKFRQFCQCESTNNHVPLPYLHLLSFRLQLKLLLRKELPFPVIGLVHIASSMRYIQRPNPGQGIDFICSVESMEQTDKGLKTNILTQAYQNHILVWESNNHYLYRNVKAASHVRSGQPKHSQNISLRPNWSLAANLGRRYATLTGDANPIHLWSFTAKLFGFKQTIAHGMSIGTLGIYQLDPKADPVTLYLEFKKPVYLPSKVVLSELESSQINQDLENAKGFDVMGTDGQLKLHAEYN